MTKKFRLRLFLIITLLALSFPALAGRTLALTHRQREEKLPSPTQKNTSQTATPITLKRAWEIVNAEAQNWQRSARVVSLHSIDHPNDSSASGQSGQRRAWQAVILSGSGAKTERVITLVDGLIQDDIQQSTGSEERLALEQPQIDSPEALQRALKFRPAFAPEEGKGQGFHFMLGRSSDTPVVTVRGSRGNLPAIIRMDASNGTLHEAKAMGFEAGGILYSRDAGQTWHASDLTDKMIMAVIPDPTTPGQVYAVGTQNQQIIVYRTQNGGKNWAYFGSLPKSAGDWPFDLEATMDSSGKVHLLVGTWSGVWSSMDGKQWISLSGLPEGPKQWLAVAHSPQGGRLFVSVTAGEKPGVYASEDFSNWSQLTPEPLRLSKSFDAQTVLATNEQSTASAWLLSSKGETQIELEEPILRAAGDFDSDIFAVQSTQQGTGYCSDREKTWTLSVPVASLAASTSFSEDRVIVAGGFRTGIYRSSDAGQTWDTVLSNPAQVVPGSNEIYDLAFLSGETVIAVNGSTLTWEDF